MIFVSLTIVQYCISNISNLCHEYLGYYSQPRNCDYCRVLWLICIPDGLEMKFSCVAQIYNLGNFSNLHNLCAKWQILIYISIWSLACIYNSVLQFNCTLYGRQVNLSLIANIANHISFIICIIFA